MANSNKKRSRNKRNVKNQNRKKRANLDESNLSKREPVTISEKIEAHRKRREKRDSKEAIKFQPRLRINPGIVVFLVLLAYIIIMVVTYFKSEPVTPYEVKIGSLAVNNTYMGVALREEEVVASAYSGYINYYAREGEKIPAYSMVYTVDSTGKLSDMMNDNTGDGSSLSSEDLSEIRENISDFAIDFSPKNFAKTYDFKYDIEGSVLKLANRNVLANIDVLREQHYTDSIDFGYSPKSGVIVYSTDGYETLTAEELTDDLMNIDNYEENKFQSNDLIAQDDNAYKLITSELWSIIAEIEEEKALSLEQESYVEVRFLKNNYKSWASVSILRQNGKTYAKLDFNNSMVTFASDRFLEIEILDNAQEGLKVPQSAIVERPFYLIPMDYLTYGSNLDEPGFIRESYLEDGSLSSEFVAATIYNSNDEDYYVDQNVFKVGDYIIKPETGDRYPISKQANLIGVYNINKGYADFKQITILNENEEYAIVKSNTEYGLSAYDHIVLKGDSVSENDFIYE